MVAHATALAPSRPPSASHWRELYRQALFEADRTQVSIRIHDAEKALLCREQELFALGSNGAPELEAINTALHALHALRICLRQRNRLNLAA